MKCTSKQIKLANKKWKTLFTSKRMSNNNKNKLNKSIKSWLKRTKKRL